MLTTPPPPRPHHRDSLEGVGGAGNVGRALSTASICQDVSGGAREALGCRGEELGRRGRGLITYAVCAGGRETGGRVCRHTELAVSKRRVSHLKGSPTDSASLTALPLTQQKMGWIVFFKETLQQINKVTRGKENDALNMFAVEPSPLRRRVPSSSIQTRQHLALYFLHWSPPPHPFRFSFSRGK